jgi:hypothetical protein
MSGIACGSRTNRGQIADEEGEWGEAVGTNEE